jgi:NTP pyrophosphatase (non-canonical NTP hydrolase)
MTTFNDYQTESFKTARYPQKGTGSLLAVVYAALGMGESGEVQGKVKKVIRDYLTDHALSGSKMDLPDSIKDAIVSEIGDSLWYISALATELGVTLDEVAEKNLDKLSGRLERGTICGSGDNR